MSKQVAITTLALGDVVRLIDDAAYGCGTVQQITADEVHVFRPYVHTADFSYTGGVICYIGTETVKLWKRDYRMVELVHKHSGLK